MIHLNLPQHIYSHPTVVSIFTTIISLGRRKLSGAARRAVQGAVGATGADGLHQQGGQHQGAASHQRQRQQRCGVPAYVSLFVSSTMC